MRGSGAFIATSLAGLAVITPAICQSNSTSSAEAAAIAEMEALLPTCALDCLATIIPQSACSLTDVDCICTNVPLNSNLEVCLASNCTIPEVLVAENYSKTMCGAPVRDNGYLNWAVDWPLWVVAAFSVAFRFYARSSWGKGAGLWWDDWCILVALALITVGSCITAYMAKLGLGRDIWTIPAHDITRILFFFWMEEFFYIGVLGFTKFSILFLFLRIFPSIISVKFRNCCYLLMGLTAAYCTSLIFAILFVCDPIPYFWHQWDGLHQGQCLDANAEIFASAGINITLDICVLILPIPKIWSLEMDYRKRIGVVLTFCVGAFSIICSIVRLRYLVQWGNTTNPTYDYNLIGVWSSIEGAATIICACMPQMAGPIKRFYKKTSSKLSSMGSKKYDISEVSNKSNTDYELSSKEKTDRIKKTVSASVVYDGRAPSAKSDEEELVTSAREPVSTQWPSGGKDYQHDYTRGWQL